MRYNTIPSQLFVKNRQKVLEKLPECSSAVVFSNPQMPNNGDEFHPYRQSSDFFYLTGIVQEKSILILTNALPEKQAILFILEQKPELEQWEGRKLTNAEATEISWITEIHFIENFNAIWDEIANQYDSNDKKIFLDYLANGINDLDIPNKSDIERILLDMYANPVKNKFSLK